LRPNFLILRTSSNKWSRLTTSMTCFACLLASILASASSTEVYVMMPLDEVTNRHTLKDRTGLGLALDKLREANVDGIMLDVWWGLTEVSPRKYNFNASRIIVDMAKDRNLKVQLVTSFHQCGGNVGDICDIKVPKFLHDHDIFYKDKWGNVNIEYVSLFADHYVVMGRSVLHMYYDWFVAFAEEFADELGTVITQVQVGMGPAGELRYPAYKFPFWEFCGIGAFQCYDPHALDSLRSAAFLAEHPGWAYPPQDVHSSEGYNTRPQDSIFFQEGYKSAYGKFFLDWYFSELKRHAAEVLSRANAVFGGKVEIAGKVAGIHWWFKTPHHAAEVTAGYYNTNGRDAYAEITEVFATHNASIDFTCLEMLDSDHDPACESGPEGLVKQVKLGAKSAGIAFNGENALARYDDTAYKTIESYRNGMKDFTYLRLGPMLTEYDGNFDRFKAFVQRMHTSESRLMWA